jgi:hypothetical protein
MDNPLPSSITPEVASYLGYYVYLYVDPRSGKPFYVGKGQGQRALSHLTVEGESRKAQMLQDLERQGITPQIDILAHALPDEETALRIEAAVIDLLGLDGLSNKVRGWRSIQLGRMSLNELVVYYAATPIDIDDRVILIRINRLYRHGMSEDELYEATRGVWPVGKRRLGAKFAFAIFEGVVREVYEIHTWHEAGTTHYTTRPKKDVDIRGRWEFEGQITTNDIRNKYVDHSVRRYFSRGDQAPVRYINC